MEGWYLPEAAHPLLLTPKFASANKLSDVDAKDYGTIFYVGGHDPVFDLATDPANIKLTSDFYNAVKITSASNITTLVGAQTTDGQSIFAEELLMAVESIPFLLEDRIRSLGGEYIMAGTHGYDPEPKVVVDGHLITGQDPASARTLDEALFKALQN
ncbi:class I glutamine amidotransferase-like protein [Gymnopus androsaceus JB14]|uniref:Class I glutamine amidotransferase-like protein n=1 Tax=Gymnopus androsaceus JB14 TaxID=1447944 RepID=A0A6A4HJU6_9AGAR|nr:class I glutamine amidotransferase-like protein [Gymnopus androsaceus JB14]